MILNALLAALACLSIILLLWQWLAARRFPLHQRIDSRHRISPVQPGLTLLKPVKGCDAETADCFRSWMAQDYRGEVQILFGVASEHDPACETVRRLIAQFPSRDAQLVICGDTLGINSKVSKLIQLQRHAKHDDDSQMEVLGCRTVFIAWQIRRPPR